MKTRNKNLFFFDNLEEANQKFNSLAKPCDLTENILINHKKESYINGYYVEVRTGEKTLAEIGHSNTKLIRQK